MSARGGLRGGKTTGGWSEELAKIAAAGRLFGSTGSDSTLRFFRIRVGGGLFSLGTGNSTWSTCGMLSSWLENLNKNQKSLKKYAVLMQF